MEKSLAQQVSDARNATMPGNGQDPGVDVLVDRLAGFTDAQYELNVSVSQGIAHFAEELKRLTVDNVALRSRIEKLEQLAGIE